MGGKWLLSKTCPPVLLALSMTAEASVAHSVTPRRALSRSACWLGDLTGASHHNTAQLDTHLCPVYQRALENVLAPGEPLSPSRSVDAPGKSINSFWRVTAGCYRRTEQGRGSPSTLSPTAELALCCHEEGGLSLVNAESCQRVVEPGSGHLSRLGASPCSSSFLPKSLSSFLSVFRLIFKGFQISEMFFLYPIYRQDVLCVFLITVVHQFSWICERICCSVSD